MFYVCITYLVEGSWLSNYRTVVFTTIETSVKDTNIILIKEKSQTNYSKYNQSNTLVDKYSQGKIQSRIQFQFQSSPSYSNLSGPNLDCFTPATHST